MPMWLWPEVAGHGHQAAQVHKRDAQTKSKKGEDVTITRVFSVTKE